MAMKLTSTAFEHHGVIPSQYTCDAENISPPLQWYAIPKGSKSLLLVIDDPDAPDPRAPKLIWVHWLVYNISPALTGLPENSSRNLPDGALEGINDWQRTGYGGPCPPMGNHRYFHKLYALDIVLPDLTEPEKKDLLEAMEGHVLDTAELIGTYQKTN